MKPISVAIDGPVSAGKSIIGSKVAARLSYLFIDTGLMYRAVAWKIQTNFASKKKWSEMAALSKFEWRNNPSSPTILLDGVDVSEKLFSPDISLLSSQIATNSEIRKSLVKCQHDIAKEGGVVMVGRDIGTVVLPDAPVKVFLTASVDARASRRYQDLKERGINISLDQVKEEMIERDRIDSTRVDSPLKPAEDAVLIDSTTLSIEAVVEKILAYVQTAGLKVHGG